MVHGPRSISRTLQTTDRWVRAASREDMVAVRRRPRRADRVPYELAAPQELVAMELLSEFDTSDPVTELLRVVRVRSTVYCRSLMRAPWGFGVEAHGNPAFHVVTSGRCWLEIDGEADQTALAAGDLVVLPAGPRHWLRDDP